MAIIHKRKILVAIDGSAASMDTVLYLADLLPVSSTQLVLFSVLTESPEFFWDIDYEPSRVSQKVWLNYRRKTLETFMEKAKEVFEDNGFDKNAISVKIQPRSKGIARDIIEESAAGYDCAVFGRVGINPITRLMIGSVANKLIDTIVTIPVCIVGKNLNNKKILVPVDTSEGAMRAAKFAGKMFAETDAQFLLLHVFRDYEFNPEGIQLEDEAFVKEGLWSHLAQEEKLRTLEIITSVMSKAKEELEKFGISPDQIATKILTGMATRGGSIAAQALMSGYGTIVIGRRGFSQVKEFNMGRVCYKVIQMANELAVWVVS